MSANAFRGCDTCAFFDRPVTNKMLDFGVCHRLGQTPFTRSNDHCVKWSEGRPEDSSLWCRLNSHPIALCFSCDGTGRADVNKEHRSEVWEDEVSLEWRDGIWVKH
jgi:hypothetical protein